ncbi:hypothetical protein GGD63_006591 [Bradyrhizobium sp. cir1]|uniref:hypothetical protein n=1 Tax=Bradyrhizobium sp. cir1 TaxID=1445730 RepID=UPI001605CBB8|nr:hypothetical protein [Bradyrhizobium sp. cir1]MBB4373763.1 hypothetical protein [Bradyrhizobium sp. cir1]
MAPFDGEISRISKLFIDLEQADTDAVLRRRQTYMVALNCGDDVAPSYTLQLAVLTAAIIGIRCFPGAIRAVVSPVLAAAPLRVWPWLGLSFGQALAQIIGPDAVAAEVPIASRVLVFGAAAETKGALRVTFDGWTAKAGPADKVMRLSERQYFSAVGILAASLAMSELFLSFAGIDLLATRRPVGLSLWRPDLPIDHPDALGLPVSFLPRSFWLLGLGHLGNAYLWALATLPYARPTDADFALFDFDKVIKDNVETGVLFETGFVNKFKPHACDIWLNRHGFQQVRLVERRFDASFRLQGDEPTLALCGFDTNPARRDLPNGGFARVIESGLGGTANNFDTISFHTLPNPRSPDDLWPDQTKAELAKIEAEQERVASENCGYQKLAQDICGRRDLAGKSVAVPFVGTTAASLVVGEAVKLLHDGPAYHGIKLSLGDLARVRTIRNGNYSALDTAAIASIERNPL